MEKQTVEPTLLEQYSAELSAGLELMDHVGDPDEARMQTVRLFLGVEVNQDRLSAAEQEINKIRDLELKNMGKIELLACTPHLLTHIYSEDPRSMDKIRDTNVQAWSVITEKSKELFQIVFTLSDDNLIFFYKTLEGIVYKYKSNFSRPENDKTMMLASQLLEVMDKRGLELDYYKEYMRWAAVLCDDSERSIREEYFDKALKILSQKPDLSLEDLSDHHHDTYSQRHTVQIANLMLEVAKKLSTKRPLIEERRVFKKTIYKEEPSEFEEARDYIKDWTTGRSNHYDRYGVWAHILKVSPQWLDDFAELYTETGDPTAIKEKFTDITFRGVMDLASKARYQEAKKVLNRLTAIVPQEQAEQMRTELREYLLAKK